MENQRGDLEDTVRWRHMIGCSPEGSSPKEERSVLGSTIGKEQMAMVAKPFLELCILCCPFSK